MEARIEMDAMGMKWGGGEGKKWQKGAEGWGTSVD